MNQKNAWGAALVVVTFASVAIYANTTRPQVAKTSAYPKAKVVAPKVAQPEQVVQFVQQRPVQQAPAWMRVRPMQAQQPNATNWWASANPSDPCYSQHTMRVLVCDETDAWTPVNSPDGPLEINGRMCKVINGRAFPAHYETYSFAGKPALTPNF